MQPLANHRPDHPQNPDIGVPPKPGQPLPNPENPDLPGTNSPDPDDPGQGQPIPPEMKSSRTRHMRSPEVFCIPDMAMAAATPSSPRR